MRVFEDTSQGGSVAGFLIVGAVLLALALGGVYFIQQRDNNVTTNTGSSSSPKVSKDTAKDKSEETPSSKNQNSSSTVDDNSSRRSLPETGPMDSLYNLVAIATLTGFAVAYIQSNAKQRTLNTDVELD